MYIDEVDYYIRARYQELTMDEIKTLIDVEENPWIERIEYDGDVWRIWDENHKMYEFVMREWR